jgi:hypothetical protein
VVTAKGDRSPATLLALAANSKEVKEMPETVLDLFKKARV